jgi:hypothetical protein
MTNFVVESRSGEAIRNLDEWLERAPPRRHEKHWRDRRSAKELARGWVDGVVPTEVRALLDTNASTRGLRVERVIAEWPTRLDGFGGPRMNDLIVIGECDGGRVLIAVEGKVAETFDLVVVDKLAKPRPSSSRLADRMRLLGRGVLGAKTLAQIAGLRYQLLQAAAGAVIEARLRGAAQGILLVHEFHCTGMPPDAVRRNAADLDAFVSALVGRSTSLSLGGLQCVPNVPGGRFIPRDVSLSVGRAVKQIPGLWE